MTHTKTMLAAAALCVMLPAAAFAQASGGSATMSAPRAGDASTGGSGGGNTGANAKASEMTGSTAASGSMGSMHASSKCKAVLAHPSKYSKTTVANCR